MLQMNSKKNCTMSIAKVSEVLETYDGRDKFLKTLSYAAKLATVFTKSDKTAQKFKHFGSQMSGCRVILRLFDDVTILYETMEYGWGKMESNKYTRSLTILRNVVDLIAAPIEHICWAGEQKFIEINDRLWDHLSTLLWIAYINLSLLISVQKAADLHRELTSSRVCLSIQKQNTLKRNYQLFTCARMVLDLSYAISYLPRGSLWGGRLKTWQVGALGTLSSLIGLYQTFKNFESRKTQEMKPDTLSCSCVHCLLNDRKEKSVAPRY